MAIDSKRLREKARERRDNRRYDARHRAIKQMLIPFVRSGLASCARCGEPLSPDEPFDLGHDDYDLTAYSGPEHPLCNRGAPHRNVTSRQW